MSNKNPNNLYNILASFNAATKAEEVTPKQQAKAIYESVEAKGSIMGGVKGVEKKLSEAFAKHKEQVSELSTGTLKSYGKKAEKDSAKHLSKAAKLTDKAYSQYNKGGAAADKSWDTIDKAEKHVDKSEKRAAGADKAAGKIASKTSNGANESLGDVAALGVIGAGAGAALGAAANMPFGKSNRSVIDRVSDFRSDRRRAATQKTLAAIRKNRGVTEDGGKEINFDSIEIDGVDRRDHPDYSDAYISYAEYEDGTPVPDELLDQLTDEHSDVVNQKANDSMYSEGIMDEPETVDTPTGRIHKAKPGGYGLKDTDDIPQELDPGQVARGRGRPKGLPAMLRAQKAAELAAQGVDPNAPRGRGRPKKAGGANSAPAGTLDLQRFLFGAPPAKLPGKPGIKHKMADTGTERGRVAAITGESIREAADRPTSLKGYLAEAAGAPGLQHIANRFKHEVKQFAEFGEMEDSGPLYDALFDYYLDNGEIPYGVAKARSGDPYQWVCNKFERDMGFDVSEFEEAVDPMEVPAVQRKERGDAPLGLDDVINPNKGHMSDIRNLGGDHARGSKELDDLARLAGITETEGGITRTADHSQEFKFGTRDQMPASDVAKLAPRVSIKNIKTKQRVGPSFATREQALAAFKKQGLSPREFTVENISESMSVIGGEVEAEDDSKMNISTNQSSDGTKNVTVTADGEAAVALLQMLKMAGMGSSEAAQGAEERASAVVVDLGDEGGQEVEMEEEYSNESEPSYKSVDAAHGPGEGDGGEKAMHKHSYRNGDNPMAMRETAKEADPIKSMGRDLMAEYQAMKIKK